MSKKKFQWWPIVCLSCLLMIFSSGKSQDRENNGAYRVNAVQISRNLHLTGTLSDTLWLLAPPVYLNYEIAPRENFPSSQRTNFRVLYNSEFIYLGIVCEDTEISKLRAHLTDRDKLFEDDYVAIMLDTYRDGQKTYEFLVNPLGVQADGIRSPQSQDYSWDAVWTTATKIGDKEWTVEVAIPLKILRFPQHDNQDWRLIVQRNMPRESRMVFRWTPIDRNNPCFTCQGGLLGGINIQQKVTVRELLPYGTVSQTRVRANPLDPRSNISANDPRARMGSGLKYSPSSTFLMEGVINPDFSQVETDATQISINSTFALYYPEKRPFFLEGFDLFSTRLNVFYTRMINNPVLAVKMIRKLDNFSLGLLTASDRNTVFIIPGEESSSIVQTTLRSVASVVRGRYDFGKESFIGTILAARNTDVAYNYAGGVDWSYLFAGNNYFRGQALYSLTKEVNDLSLFNDLRTFRNSTYDASFNGQRYDGKAIRINFSHLSRHYNLQLSYNDISPTFQSQVGFMPNSDTRSIEILHLYAFYPESGAIDYANVFAQAKLNFNYSGDRKQRWVQLGTSMQLKPQTYISFVHFLTREEMFRSTHFNDTRLTTIYLQSQPVRPISTTVYFEVGNFIYRTSKPVIGSGHNASLDLLTKLTDKFQLSFSYSRAQLRDKSTGILFFDGYVARNVANYQFSPEFFFRLITQYDSFNKSVEIFPLLSYKLNPFSIFYLGATGSFSNFGDVYGFVETERQYFLKFQYLFHF